MIVEGVPGLLSMIVICLAMPAIADDSVTLVHAGTLLAVPGDAPKQEQTITLRGNKIEKIEDGFINPASVPAR